MRAILCCLVLCAACDGSVSRAVGARCAVSSDCDDRCLAPSTDYPGGFCTLTCDTDADCPNDAACVQAEQGVCLFTCTDNRSCDFLGTGWVCDQVDGRPSGKVNVCRGG